MKQFEAILSDLNFQKWETKQQTWQKPRSLSGPPRVSQSGVELEKFFECDFMASDDAYGSYKTYGKVRLKFGPI